MHIYYLFAVARQSLSVQRAAETGEAATYPVATIQDDKTDGLHVTD